LGEFGSTRQLFDETANQFSLAGAGSIAVPLNFLVFASWLPEFAPVAPFLWIVVPAPFSTAALKQTLRLLCRHALVMNVVSNSWPTSLPMVLQPTLIAEVDRPSRRLCETLRASQSHGFYPTRTAEVVDPFCTKVILSREPPEDPAGLGFPLVIFLDSEAECASLMERSEEGPVAQKFQNKFFTYRVENSPKVGPPSFDLGQVSAPVRALAHSLAGAIVDGDLQLRIVPYLQECDADFRTDSAATLRRTIVEALVAQWAMRKSASQILLAISIPSTLGADAAGTYRQKLSAGSLRPLGFARLPSLAAAKALRWPMPVP
jgi:hypothetical protein